MTEIISSSNYELDNVKNIYEQIANHFKVTRVFTWSWIDNFILSLSRGSSIYDIGCGNGRNMAYPNYNFIGFDNCENFITICREKNLNVKLSNMMNIESPSNSADAIICIAAFHHLSSEKHRLQSLSELRRLIKPDGKILLSVWSIIQPDKTRRKFDKYGDTLVKWNKKYNRYYYIFQIKEILSLFAKSNLIVLEHNYDCGNEIFILTKI